MFIYITLLLLALIYYTITRKYSYFKNKNIAHIKPTFLFGNLKEWIFLKKTMGENVQDICKQFPDEKFIGVYMATEPVLIPTDPEIIKLIVTKDFYYFNGRELSEHNHKEPAALNLFATHGDSWKVLRQNMTPLFSSAKMKNMFHLIEKCSHIFESMLNDKVTKPTNMEVRELTAKFTVECIASCAFGVDANTMNDNARSNPFSKISGSVTDTSTWDFYIRLYRAVWPSMFYAMGLRLLKNQIIFFHNLITSVMGARNYKPSGRHDFVDLVSSWKVSNSITGDSIQSLKTNEKHKVSLQADDDLLVAQCFVFFTAGFETSSTTLSYTLYELAKQPTIQNRVIEEIDSYLARHNNKLNYECITELPYLDACIDEALRLYPVLSIIFREQMEDYTFPNGVRTEKGLRVYLPVLYLHYNPKYFPNPEEFRPERFLGEEKKKIYPYTYMPFGEGPRTCIGMRFAKMQMMAGFITILKKYRLELAEDMPRKVSFKPHSFLTRPTDGIKLKFIERQGWENRVFVN